MARTRHWDRGPNRACSKATLYRRANDSLALEQARRILEETDIETLSREPMASGAADDRLDPRELQLTIPYGVEEAAETTFTVRWTTAGDYNIHYSDTEAQNVRLDRHPHEFPTPPDDRHFHPPPDVSNADEQVEPSCLDGTQISLVARAVHLAWRQALEADSLAGINTGTNPP